MWVISWSTAPVIGLKKSQCGVPSVVMDIIILSNDNPVINTDKISFTGGVRDPHILRSQDDKTFYMVLTDMTSHKGWDTNRTLILLKLSNLIDWQSTVINIQDRFERHQDLKRAWTPQTIYDDIAGKYMVYRSMLKEKDLMLSVISMLMRILLTLKMSLNRCLSHNTKSLVSMMLSSIKMEFIICSIKQEDMAMALSML